MHGPVTRKELYRLKQFISDELGVNPTIRVMDILHLGYVGRYLIHKDVILLDKSQRRGDFIQTLMHEAVHSYCSHNDIFYLYHNLHTIEKLTRRELLGYVSTAVRAELYVERRACELADKYDPKLEYWICTRKQFEKEFANLWPTWKKHGLV